MAVVVPLSAAPNLLARSRALSASELVSACGVDSAAASAPFVVDDTAVVPNRSALALRFASSESMSEVGRLSA